MMPLSRMRIIDDTLGMFICYFLGFLMRIKNAFFPVNKKIKPEQVKKILCQKYFGMGSILNALPLINALRKNYPNAKIIFLTLGSGGEVIKLCQMADEVLTIRLDSFAQLVKDTTKLITYLMSQKIDISIDLEFFSKFTLIISFFACAKVRIGLYQKRIRPSGILTHTVYYNSYRHLSKIYFAYANVLGIESECEDFIVSPPSLKEAIGEKMIQRLNLKREIPIVVIDVNSSELFKFRCWPADYFVELIKTLIRNHQEYYYVLIGEAKDCAYVNGIYEKIGENERLINASGKTSIEELFALLEMSHLLITNDSGPLHIASLYGKNIAVFFGPETPIVYGPLNSNALIFYSNDLYCSPCLSVYDSKKALYGETCLKNTCLMKFSPQDVYNKIEERFLSRRFTIPQNNNICVIQKEI